MAGNFSNSVTFQPAGYSIQELAALLHRNSNPYTYAKNECMRNKKKAIVVAFLIIVVALIQCTKVMDHTGGPGPSASQPGLSPDQSGGSLVAEGKQIFRFDTFGDEDFWSGLLHLDSAIAGANNGGFGPGVSPKPRWLPG